MIFETSPWSSTAITWRGRSGMRFGARLCFVCTRSPERTVWCFITQPTSPFVLSFAASLPFLSFARPWIERFDISLPRLFARPSTVAPLSMRCRVNETRERGCTLVAYPRIISYRSLILQWCSHDVNIYFILFHGSTVEKVGFNNTKDISLIHNRNFILFYIFISDWKIESDEI